jgi:hypothetical protein
MCFYAELKINDDSNVTINLVVQVRRQPTFIYHTLTYFYQCPGTHQEILDSAVKVADQTKIVLDQLGGAKKFLQTIMGLGASASEASSQSSR